MNGDKNRKMVTSSIRYLTTITVGLGPICFKAYVTRSSRVCRYAAIPQLVEERFI